MSLERSVYLTVVTLSYRPVVKESLSCRLHSARSHLKQKVYRIVSYRMVS